MSDFFGQFDSTIDPKGRFLLPASLKKQLDENDNSFFITRGIDTHLWLYPKSSWLSIVEKIRSLNRNDPKVILFLRQFLNGAVEVEMDTAGRVLIQGSLKEYANLSKDIVLLAVFDKIEIWDSGNYNKLFVNQTTEQFSQLYKDVLGN